MNKIELAKIILLNLGRLLLGLLWVWLGFIVSILFIVGTDGNWSWRLDHIITLTGIVILVSAGLIKIFKAIIGLICLLRDIHHAKKCNKS